MGFMWLDVFDDIEDSERKRKQWLSITLSVDRPIEALFSAESAIPLQAIHLIPLNDCVKQKINACINCSLPAIPTPTKIKLEFRRSQRPSPLHHHLSPLLLSRH